MFLRPPQNRQGMLDIRIAPEGNIQKDICVEKGFHDKQIVYQYRMVLQEKRAGRFRFACIAVSKPLGREEEISPLESRLIRPLVFVNDGVETRIPGIAFGHGEPTGPGIDASGRGCIGFPEALFDQRGKGAFLPAGLGLRPFGQVFINRYCKRNLHWNGIYPNSSSGQSASMVPKPMEFISPSPQAQARRWRAGCASI